MNYNITAFINNQKINLIIVKIFYNYLNLFEQVDIVIKILRKLKMFILFKNIQKKYR